MKTLKEMTDLKFAMGTQLRSSQQLNHFYHADCEILKLDSKNYLTTSCDSIGEEITIGLYRHVQTWAWLTVMNSVSDLAASGSKALGLTLSTQWKAGTSPKMKR
jgi:thiamine monophosphate kinase